MGARRTYLYHYRRQRDDGFALRTGTEGRHFKNPKIDIVDAHMVHVGMKEEGIFPGGGMNISLRSAKLKHRPGGGLGQNDQYVRGCFACDQPLFQGASQTWSMDFFLTMKVLNRAATRSMT